MKKPPPALKFDPWNLKPMNTMIVSTGIATFHHVSELFTRASQRTPTRLTIVNRNIRINATTIPTPVSFVPLYQLCAKWAVEMYSIAASTSIGATAAACRYDIHPNVAPANEPNA